MILLVKYFRVVNSYYCEELNREVALPQTNKHLYVPYLALICLEYNLADNSSVLF